MFDLYLLPLNLADGREQNALPGLFVGTPSRRSNRSRSEDLLIALLTFNRPPGGDEFNPQDLLQKLSDAYFSSTGSVTAGMRAATEALNETLLAHNLQSGRQSGQLIGLFNLVVIHRNAAYIIHAGPTYSYVLTGQNAEEFSDTLTAGRGLGLAKGLSLRYFTAEVQPNGLLIFSPNPPASWSEESLAGGARLPIEHLRRRLLNQASASLQAAVIQLQNGNGQIHRLRVRPSAASAAPEAAVIPPASPTPQPAATQPAAAAPAVELTAPAESPAAPVIPSAPVSVNDSIPPAVSESIASTPAPAASPARRSPRPAPHQRPAHTGAWRKALARLWVRGRSTGQKASKSGRSLLGRMIPGSGEQLPAISSGWLLFIAIAIPLMVVAVAATVFIRSGQTEQQAVYFQQAQSFAAQAAKEKDATLKHNAWEQTLFWLDKTEKFGETDESHALRAKAQKAIDNMDSVARLSLEAALPGGFSSSVKITRMVATSNDVYLLDSNSGSVRRMVLSGQTYDVDQSFSCGPAMAGGVIVGKLVDVQIAPLNSFDATVIAVDETGNLVMCTPGQEQVVKVLPAPKNNWGKIAAISIDSDALYVLDVNANAVWRYPGNSLIYNSVPVLIFSDTVPDLSNAIDLTNHGNDIFILRKTGRMLKCTFSEYKDIASQCDDPAAFGDDRPGRKKAPNYFEDAAFTQMTTAQPYMLYMLDSGKDEVSGWSVYQFSLNQNLQQVLRPDSRSNVRAITPTAFAVTEELSPNRRILVAFGNQVFYSTLP